MKPERISRMPYWPARMDAELAALFLGVGTTTFAEGAGTGKYPAPVTEGRRKLWARVQLERFVESQFGIATASEDGTWADLP